MKQFKALVIKDLQANRKSLMWPIWYLLGMYVFIAGSMIYAYSSGNTNMSFSGIPLSVLQNNNLHRMMSLVMQSSMFFGFLGIVFAISTSILGSTMLNQDIKNKCELFHRSQPVSVWKISASRFIAGVIGPIMMALVLGIVNLMLSNILMIAFTPLNVDWWMSINGLVLSWAHFAVAMLVAGSIFFLFSAIFRDNAFGLGLGSLGILQLLTLILNKLYGWNLPYIFTYLSRLVMSGILKISNVMPSSHQFGIINIQTGKEPDISNFVVPDYFLYNLWTTLFTWDMALKFVFCGAFFLVATYIYRQREVQF